MVVAAVYQREFSEANPRIPEMSRQAGEPNPIVEAFVSNACSIQENGGLFAAARVKSF
jgi:hypothetical protein